MYLEYCENVSAIHWVCQMSGNYSISLYYHMSLVDDIVVIIISRRQMYDENMIEDNVTAPNWSWNRKKCRWNRNLMNTDNNKTKCSIEFIDRWPK